MLSIAPPLLICFSPPNFFELDRNSSRLPGQRLVTSPANRTTNGIAVSPPPLEQLFREFFTTGNEDSLALWMRRSGPPLRQLGLRLGASAEDVEDLVQETFVAAIQGADRYDPERPMLPWLKGILTFRAARLARDEVRRKHHYQASTSSTQDSSPAPDHAHVELDGDVRQAIDDLPEQYREPLTQYLLAQRSPVEIAEAMGVKRATVRVRLHRGLQRLRDALRRWGAMVLAVLFGRRAAAATAARVAVVLCLTLAALYSWPADLVEDPQVSHAAARETARGDEARGSSGGQVVERVAVTGPNTKAISRVGTVVIRTQHRHNDPVRGVGVAFEPAFGKDPVLHRRTLVTDELGTAVCADVPVGTWRVQTDRGQQMTIEVTAGAQEHVLTVAGGRHVVGTVVDQASKPVADALVWLSRGVDGPWRGTAVVQTDADGHFELDNVPVGAFLAARHSRHARGAPQKVAPGDEHVFLQLAGVGGRVALRVTDVGRPVADAVVFVGDAMDATPLWLAQGAAPWCPPPFTGRTNARGEFVAEGLEPGEHPVFVRAPGHAPYRAVVRVDALVTRWHDARLLRGATVRGIVCDTAGQGISNALVIFRHDDSSASIDACSDPQGRFVFECLPVGSGQVLAKASGFAVGASHVDLQTREHDCEVTLAATHDLVGRVLLEGRAPPRGSLLRAIWPPSALRDSTAVAPIDADGRFVFANAVTGNRPLMRIRLGDEPVWRDVDPYAEWHSQELTLRIPGAFVATSWISGRCLGDDGMAIANARIHVCRDGRWGEVGRTDVTGYYRIGPLPAASYRVFAEATQRDSPTVVTDAFTLAAHSDRRVDLTATPSGVVAIDLRRRDGKPLTDVLWTVQRVDLHRRFAVGNQARMRQRLEAGDYVLSVMGSSVAWIDEHRFTIAPGAATSVSVALQPAHRCTLVLAGFPPRAEDRATTVVIRSVADKDSKPTVTVLPDAPLRLGAVLAPGSYWLEHTALDGSSWRGNFDVATAQEALEPILVSFAQVGNTR